MVARSLPALSGASIATELSRLLEANDIHGSKTDELLKDKITSTPS